MSAAAFSERVAAAAGAIVAGEDDARSLEVTLGAVDGDAVRLGLLRLAIGRMDVRCGLARYFGRVNTDAAAWSALLIEFADWPDESLPRLAEALRQEDCQRRAVIERADRLRGRELFDLYWYGPSSQVWHTAFRADTVPAAQAFVRTWADAVTIRLIPFRDGAAVLLDAHGVEYAALPAPDLTMAGARCFA